MPVLLAPEQAPTLECLLSQANVLGLPVTLVPDTAASLRIQGLGSLEGAQGSEISFLSNPRLIGQLGASHAAAVILTQQAWQAHSAQNASPRFAAVLCEQPYALYALLAQWFDRQRRQDLPTGIHPSAVVHPSAHIGEGVSLGPFCVIDANVHIGSGSRLEAHVVVGRNSRLGTDCLLHPRVTLYADVQVGDRAIFHSGVVLGADGFGFAPDPGNQPGAWVKIAQLGSVVIGNDVEIGANTTIDRGALDATIIGNGVKLDNQIMIGHNVSVGDHTAMAACVGVAGSTRIGQRCVIGGAAMFSGHLELADDVHISGGTAVTSHIRQAGRYTGVFPLATHRDWQKNAAALARLADLRRRLRELESAESHNNPGQADEPAN